MQVEMPGNSYDSLAQAQMDGFMDAARLDMSTDSSSTYSPSPPAPPDSTDNDAYLRMGDSSPHPSEVEVASPRAMADISIWCKRCCMHVSLRELTWHKQYHRALQILRYSEEEESRPSTVEALLQRRNDLLRDLSSQQTGDKPLPPATMRLIDEAYEVLKADLLDTYEEYRRMLEDPCLEVNAISLNCSPGCVYAVGICSEGNDRWKNAMEDTRVFQDFFGNDQEKCFFGIYDGHHGRFAAEVSANELHHGLLTEMEKFDPRTTCTCTLNMASCYDISQYEIISRPPSQTAGISTPGTLHEESTNIVQQVIRMCQDNLEVLAGGKEKDVDHKYSPKPKEKKTFRDPFEENMHTAFSKAHRYIDNILSYGKDERSRVRWSGVSTLSCVIQGKKTLDKDKLENQEAEESNGEEKRVFGEALKEEDEEQSQKEKSEVNVQDMDRGKYEEKEGSSDGMSTPEKKVDPPIELGTIHISNAGNVEGLLVRANRAYKITKKHTPHNPKEKARVLRTGVPVSDSERDMVVNGVLLTTRGLGNHGDPKLKKCVLVEPHSNSIPIDQYAQFMVLASRGVWSVLDEEDVAHLMLQMLPEQQVPGPSRVSSSVAKLLSHLEAVSHAGLVPGPLFKSRPTSQASSSSMLTAVGSQHQLPLKSSLKKDRPLTGQSTKSKASVTILESSKESIQEVSQPMDSQSKNQTQEEVTGQQQSGNSQPVTSDAIKQVETVKSDETTSKKSSVKSVASKGSKLAASNVTVENKSLGSDSQLLDELTSAQALQQTIEQQSGEKEGSEHSTGEKERHDSGNEADIDTELGAGQSMVPESPLLEPKITTREEVHREYARRMAERLTQAALLAGARDNITVMVVLLPGSGL